MLVRRLLPCVLLALLPGALAAQSTRGGEYAMSVATDSGGRKTTMSMDFKLLGSKLRMSVKSEMAAGPMVDMYIVIDSVAGTMTTVIPAQSIAMVMSSSILSDSTMTPYTMAFAGAPKFDVVDLGPGEPILGHATRHYRQTVAYVQKTTFGADVCSNSVNEVAELWTTTEIDAPDMMMAMMRFTPAAGRAALVETLDSLRRAKIKGVILRRTSTGSIFTPAGDTMTVRTSWDLTALKPGSVDSTDFDLPLGYTVMDTRQAMAGMDPDIIKQGMVAGQAHLAEELKKTVCGGRKPQ
jgi:hypothetical protein